MRRLKIIPAVCNLDRILLLAIVFGFVVFFVVFVFVVRSEATELSARSRDGETRTVGSEEEEEEEAERGGSRGGGGEEEARVARTLSLGRAARAAG